MSNLRKLYDASEHLAKGQDRITFAFVGWSGVPFRGRSPPAVAIHQLFDQIELAFNEIKELPYLIEAGQRDEANLWLRRTQWAVYLRGINPQHLVEVESPDRESLDATEQAACVI